GDREAREDVEILSHPLSESLFEPVGRLDLALFLEDVTELMGDEALQLRRRKAEDHLLPLLRQLLALALEGVELSPVVLELDEVEADLRIARHLGELAAFVVERHLDGRGVREDAELLLDRPERGGPALRRREQLH